MVAQRDPSIYAGEGGDVYCTNVRCKKVLAENCGVLAHSNVIVVQTREEFEGFAQEMFAPIALETEAHFRIWIHFIFTNTSGGTNDTRITFRPYSNKGFVCSPMGRAEEIRTYQGAGAGQQNTELWWDFSQYKDDPLGPTEMGNVGVTLTVDNVGVVGARKSSSEHTDRLH